MCYKRVGQKPCESRRRIYGSKRKMRRGRLGRVGGVYEHDSTWKTLKNDCVAVVGVHVMQESTQPIAIA